MDLRGKRIEEGYTNLVTVEGDSVASSGKLQNGQGTDLGDIAVGGLSFNSGDGELQLPAGTTAERPASPSAGYARFNTDKGKVEIYTGASWLSIALEGAVQLSTATATVTANDAVFEAVATFFGNRGLFGGGYAGSNSNVIDYVAIDTTGNATDFGDLTVSRQFLAACSNGIRGLFGGGGSSNVIDYVTIATTGNAVDFADLTVARGQISACSDGEYGVFGGGNSGSASNVIDYVTIDTVGNASDFGDLTIARRGLASCSSETRGLFAGGFDTENTVRYDVIDYITIATPGNAVDFGDMTAGLAFLSSCSDASRGLFAGGQTGQGGGTQVNTIQYITIDTAGNATDFGDLTSARRLMASCSNGTRGLFGGGVTVNTIDVVTIQTTSNATDFGDLTIARYGPASCSGD